MANKLRAITLGLILLVCSFFGALCISGVLSFDSNSNAVYAEEKDPFDYVNNRQIDDWSQAYNYRTYSSNGNTYAAITSAKYTDLYHYTIPAKIDGYEVRTIDNNAFQSNSYMRTVYFRPDYDATAYYIENINYRAFYGCNNLEIVYCDDYSNGTFQPNTNRLALPNTVKSIGGYAFQSSSKLGKYNDLTFNFPSSLNSLGEYAFRYCYELKGVNLSSTQITSIPSRCFYNCNKMSSVSFPASLTQIGYYAFYNNDMSSIDLSHTNVSIIQAEAFYHCRSLTNFNMSTKLTDLLPYALEYTSIETLNLPNNVINIGYWSLPSSLKTLKLPNTFYIVPADYDEYGWRGNILNYRGTADPKNRSFANIFQGAPKDLTTITFSGTSSQYVVENNVLMDSSRQYIHFVTNGYSSSTFNMQNSITAVDRYAFAYNPNIETINFSSNLNFVAEQAFYHMDNLTTVSMNNSLREIASSAFAYNPKLINVVLPYSINSSYNYINYYYNGQRTYSNDCATYMFQDCDALESLSIPNGWSFIPQGFVSNCDNLISVSWNGNISRIKHYAFGYSRKLETVGDMSNVTYIESSAFSYCKSLNSINSLPSIETIDSYAFDSCAALTTLTFGRYLRTLNNEFECNTGIQNIYVDSNNSYFTSSDGVVFTNNNSNLYHFPSGREGSYAIPNGVVSIGEYAFWYSKLSSVDFSTSSLTTINDRAFYYSKLDGELKIGYNNLTTIGSYAFAYCNQLDKVTIGPNISRIEEGCFEYSTDIKEVDFTEASSLTYIGIYSLGHIGAKRLIFPEGVQTIYSPYYPWGERYYIDYVKVPVSARYYTMYTWSGWDTNSRILTLELSEGMQTFNVEKLNTNSEHKYIYIPDYGQFIIPSTLTSMADIRADELSVVMINGSVTNGTRSSILIPTNCDFRGKILVPAEDYDLYYNSSAWSSFRSKLVTSINPVVKFVNKLGTTFDDQVIEFGGTAVNPGTPTCEYESATFVGWYWDNPFNENTSEPYDFDRVLYYDVTLKAKWSGIPADRYLEYEENGDGTYTIVGYIEDLDDFDEVIIPLYHPTTHGKITRIGKHAFEGGKFGALLISPDSDIYIDDYAFLTAKGLRTINLGGTTHIGNCAFMNCKNIQSLNIPGTVEYVGNSAFANCVHLKTVTWESSEVVLAAETTEFRYNNKVYLNSDDDYNNHWAIENGNYDYLFTPSLFDNMFANCNRLESVTLPNNMYVMPTRMFNNCPKLTTINLGNRLVFIKAHAFENCTALQSITLPNSLYRIGNFAFENCDLRTINIPATVTQIGYNPFLGNKNMESINVDPLNPDYSSFNGVLYYKYDPDDYSLISVPEKLVTSELNLAEYLPTIPRFFTVYRYALAYNDVIKSVTFPNVQHLSIAHAAFYGCSKLSVVVINSGHINFDSEFGYMEQFSNCPKLSIVMFNNELDYAPNIRNSNVSGDRGKAFDQPTNKIIVYAVSGAYDKLINSQWAAYRIIEFDRTVSDVFIVLFELNGGTGVEALVVAENDTINIPKPTKTGYTFAGWYADPELTMQYAMATPVTQNLFLYAKWNLLPYTITYHWNGGSTTEIEIAEDEEATDVTFYITDIADEEYNPVDYKLITPEQYGYLFVGWYMDENFTTAKYTSININDLTLRQLSGTAKIHMYARWERITYMVEIQLDDEKYAIGLSTDSTNPVGHGQNVSFTIIYKEAYTQNTPENVTLTAIELATNESTTLEAWDNNGIWYYTIENVQSSYSVTITGVKINTYIVSFVPQPTIVDTEVEDMPQKIILEHGQSVNSVITSPLTTPDRTGYDFNGWYAQRFDIVTGNILYDDFEYDFDEAVTSDMTISSAWLKETYTITLVMNGGTYGSDPAEEQYITYNIESEFLLPYNTDFERNLSRTGYTFAGWFADEEFLGEEVVGITAGTTGDLTFYAKWSPIPYTIEYTTNQGLIEGEYPTTYTIEDRVILPQAVRGGYTFRGWKDRDDVPDDEANIITEIPQGNTGRRHYYAMWESNLYNIDYYLNGSMYSQVSVGDVQVNYTLNYYHGEFIYGDETLLLSNITRTGYTFAGWYTTSTFEGDMVTSIPAEQETDFTVYAKWTPIVYTITFDANDDDKVDDGLVPLDDVVVQITYEDFNTHNGFLSVFGDFDMSEDLEWNSLHIFVGWYTAKTSGTRYTAIRPSNLDMVNMTLYAHWENDVYNMYVLPGSDVELGDYAITDLVRIMGGNGEMDKAFGSGIKFMVMVTNEAYTKSEITVDYKIGNGTLKHATLGDDDFFTITEGITNDLSLYINGLKVNRYTIYFNSVGGSEIPAITNIIHGSTATQPAQSPVKAGYTFDTWLIAGFNTDTPNTNSTTEMNWSSAIVSDIVLYARYTINPLVATIRSNLDNSLIDQLDFDAEHYIVFNANVGASMPEVTGYRFVRFEYDNALIVDTQGITDNITVYAIYEMVTYTINYSVDSGYVDETNPSSYNVNYIYYTENDEIKTKTISEGYTLKEATKTNYTFIGWYYGNIKVERIPFVDSTNHTVFDNITLTAVFYLTADDYSEVRLYDGTRLLNSISVKIGRSVKEEINIQISLGGTITFSDFTYTADKEGYTNTHKWYTDTTFTNEYDFDTPVQMATNLYIRYDLINYWIIYNYRIYDDNYRVYTGLNSSGIINSNPARYNVENEVLLQDIVANGYTFTGWFIGGVQVDRISYGNGDIGNITVDARFTYTTYYIHYSIEAGAANNNANPASYKLDDEIITLQPAFAPTGFHFVKWVLTTDVNTTVETIDPSTTTNYYLTAVFDVNKVYVYVSLYIKQNGVVRKIADAECEKDTLFTPPARPIEGYVLDGWYSDNTYTTLFDLSTPVNSDINLYARYNLVTYYITYDANIELSGNAYPTVNSYTYEDTVNIPSLVNEIGYRFDGWYTGAEKIDGVYNFNNAVAFNGHLVQSTGDIALVAKFSEIRYSILYKLDGANNSENNPESYTYNTPTIILEAPTKEGYMFDGWTRELSGGEESITTIPFHSTENYVIKANFTKIKDQLILSRRVWRDGVLYSLPDEVVALVNGKAFIRSTKPEYDGYNFDGWYSDRTTTTYFNLNIQYGDDVTMYGRFLPKEYTITYKYSVGDTQTPTNPTTYLHNGRPFILNDPSVVAGYTFEAWYIDAELTEHGYDFTNATLVTSIGDGSGDIDVVAKYGLQTYHVNYYLNTEGAENNPSNPTTFTILDTGLELFDAIAPEGYTFIGWFDTYDKQLEAIPDRYSQDIDITAKFVKDEEPTTVNKNKIYYILAAIGGIAVFFASIIIVVVIQNNKRKEVDAKRIAALVEQINDVVNKRDK